QTMLVKEPAQRYSSARDVLVDLRRIEQGEDPVFAATGATRKRKIRWRPYVAAGVAIVAIAAILLYIRAFRGPRTSPSGSAQPGSNQAVTPALLRFGPMPDNPKSTARGQGMVESIPTKLSRLTQDRALDTIPADTLQQRHVSSIADARSMFGATTGLTV